MTPKGKSKLVWLIILAILAGIWALLPSVEAFPGDKSANHININATDLLNVKTNPRQPSRIIKYTGMDVSFNPKLHIPNWVAWELTDDETDGEEPRATKFLNDENVPGCADTYDYMYSGYDRGHMAPAGDMKWSKKAMQETFYLTNICPQEHALNNGAWKNLEVKCRTWAMRDSAIYIVCGPVLTDTLREFIGDNRVAVPKRFFKVMISPYAEKPQGIGFVMPNGRVPGGIQACATTIDEVERITGHDFFSELPDELENALESQNNFPAWSRYTAKRKLPQKKHDD